MTDEELEQIAIISIRKYLNKDFTNDEIKINYPLAIKRLIINAKSLEDKALGIQTISENATSVTYKDGIEFGVITDDVKALLPRPYIRLW